MAEDVDPSKLEIADELIAERRSALPGELPDDMNALHRKIIGGIDTMNQWIGVIVSWLLVPLCLAVVFEVIVRNFGTSPAIWWNEIVRVVTGSDAPSLIRYAPTMWAYDVSRMLYGSMFMLGAGYALSKGVHIRADFIYRNWSDRMQGIIDLFMYCTFFMLGMLGLLYSGFDYAWGAMFKNVEFSELFANGFSGFFDIINNGERAMDTAWMPLLGPVRMAIPLGALFLLLQGLSEILKSWYAATRGRWPV